MNMYAFCINQNLLNEAILSTNTISFLEKCAIINLQWLELPYLEQVFISQILFEPLKFDCMFQQKEVWLYVST